MNRTQQPIVQEIGHIEYLKPQLFDITPTVKLVWMKEVQNETVRLDLFFDAGIITSDASIATIVQGLIFSGTPEISSVEFHERIDEMGGFIDTDLSLEIAIISIYCLRECLEEIAQLVAKTMNGMCFHEKEVNDTLRSLAQKFNENKQKVKNVAQQQFRNAFFQSDERYARLAEIEHFTNTQVLEMKRFYKERYLKGLTRMTLVGNVEQDTVDALIDLFGTWSLEEKFKKEGSFPTTGQEISIPVDGAIQTAIRMGRNLFSKHHPDFIEFHVLNTILGDYFGSRLMSNIREDKGYTYGIGSAVLDLQLTSYFIIVTEVGKDVADATIQEIKNEMSRLQTELVPIDELELVKNYLLGQILKGADGPYAMLDLFNAVDLYGLDLSYYDEIVRLTKAVTSERLQELAKKYLNWEDFMVVVAG